MSGFELSPQLLSSRPVPMSENNTIAITITDDEYSDIIMYSLADMQ